MSPANSKQLGLGLSELTGHFSQNLLTFHCNSQDDNPNPMGLYWILKQNGMDPWKARGHCLSSWSQTMKKYWVFNTFISLPRFQLYWHGVSESWLDNLSWWVQSCHSRILGPATAVFKASEKLFWCSPYLLHCRALVTKAKGVTPHSGLLTFQIVTPH